MLFKVAILTKTCRGKTPIMVAGKGLRKKLKSVLDTVKNVVHNADIWENTKISFFQIE